MRAITHMYVVDTLLDSYQRYMNISKIYELIANQ